MRADDNRYTCRLIRQEMATLLRKDAAPGYAFADRITRPDEASLFAMKILEALESSEVMDALAAQGMAPEHADAARAERAGTLFRLADHLAGEGVLEGPLDDMEVQHRLQKCAYIAQRLGAGIGYGFDFLDTGAFSTCLAIDVYHRGAARGGSLPFGDRPRVAGLFLGIVRRRSTEWLQAATFAMRPVPAPRTRNEFADDVSRVSPDLGRALCAAVFDEIRTLAGPATVGARA